MTALACLKVTIGEELRFGDNETMAAVVAKVAGAYLETTWLWPRRFGMVAPFSFVLADPRATQLDARELQALARDLQHKLFGDKGAGEIALLMFEGDQADVMRFAGIPATQVAALLAGEDDGSFLGRVCKITPTEVSSIVPKGGPVVGAPPMEELAREPATPSPARVGYRGVFHTGRQIFIGNVAVWREESAATGFGFEPPTADGDVAEHDIPTLRGALAALDKLEVGVVFFPLSFSTLVKPSSRSELTPHLEKLPRDRRGQLAAAIYDTPRAPSFSALSQIKRYLDPYFSRIDLRVADPAFQIDDLPPAIAASVTLVLPVATEAVRLAAVSRFMREAPAYRRKGVWQGIGDVRTRRELNACVELSAPFLTGSAITDLLEAPAAVAPCSHLHLPLHDWAGH
jgi:hypothetical protein